MEPGLTPSTFFLFRYKQIVVFAVLEPSNLFVTFSSVPLVIGAAYMVWPIIWFAPYVCLLTKHFHAGHHLVCPPPPPGFYFISSHKHFHAGLLRPTPSRSTPPATSAAAWPAPRFTVASAGPETTPRFRPSPTSSRPPSVPVSFSVSLGCLPSAAAPPALALATPAALTRFPLLSSDPHPAPVGQCEADHLPLPGPRWTFPPCHLEGRRLHEGRFSGQHVDREEGLEGSFFFGVCVFIGDNRK